MGAKSLRGNSSFSRKLVKQPPLQAEQQLHQTCTELCVCVCVCSVGYAAHWIAHPGLLHSRGGRSHRLRVLKTHRRLNHLTSYHDPTPTLPPACPFDPLTLLLPHQRPHPAVSHAFIMPTNLDPWTICRTVTEKRELRLRNLDENIIIIRTI